MFYLSVLPLTRQLSNISGNLWGKTLQVYSHVLLIITNHLNLNQNTVFCLPHLQGARAQRVEYFLLHSFHAKKYIVPDKIPARNKESNTTKRRLNSGMDGEDADDLDVNDVSPDNDALHIDQGKGKKGPAYSGGLVLEPKKGLYDKYILLLDFNSLYPSIIQVF